MTIELSNAIEAQLRGLAARQGRDVRAVVEDAVQLYVEASSLTDLEPSEVAATQAAIAHELPPVEEWRVGKP